MNAFTAAAVQIAPVYLDRDASVEKAAEIIPYGRAPERNCSTKIGTLRSCRSGMW